jgi:hypothetical protein
MAKKLAQKTFPSGHGPDDFQCFGPAATKDGEFADTRISDCGCFKQDGTDSNKYYHGAVVKSKKTGNWYAYFEWARTGAPNPSFQFVECDSEADAQAAYEKQLHSKNDKRGEWVNHASLGRILQAKAKKDCYLVRPQATRSTGLPDAKTITQNEGAKPNGNGKKKAAKKSKKLKGKGLKTDSQTMSLMRDLNVGTVNFTRSSMADSALPTQVAIDEGRDILGEAKKRVKKVGDDVDEQVADKELKQLTSMMYGRIPKKKGRNADPEEWILSMTNIAQWDADLDAFESALYTVDLGAEAEEDPFGGIPIKNMGWLSPQSELGKFIREWMPTASANRHGWVNKMKIKNVWSIERVGDVTKISRAQDRIAKDKINGRVESPLFQPKKRVDLSRDELKKFTRSKTWMLFHGTRSVNVSGIMRTSLRLPKQLVGVQITGAMFGPGIYWADDWKKSAGYCSLRNSYWAGGSGTIRGRGAFMFIADVALGKPFVAPGPSGYTKPPAGHHSVFGKAGRSHVANNEFITYSGDTNRLRYLVEFDA